MNLFLPFIMLKFATVCCLLVHFSQYNALGQANLEQTKSLLKPSESIGLLQLACKPTCLEVTITRLNTNASQEAVITPSIPVDLPSPRFSNTEEKQPYGSMVDITTNSAPTGAITEFSKDNGQTWQAGYQFSITDSNLVQARTRLGNTVSTVTKASFVPYFRRVYILGNSISVISQAPALGWFGNWGMAASSEDKDYVHIVLNRLKKRYNAVELKILGSSFERSFWNFDYEAEEFTKHLLFGPDLIIVRIGENINDEEVANRDFETAYRKLLEKMVSFSTSAKVVCTTSFWTNNDRTNAVIRKVAREKGYSVADLSTLAGNPMYQAHDFFSNKAVGDHPGDLGMRAIADLIWGKTR